KNQSASIANKAFTPQSSNANLDLAAKEIKKAPEEAHSVRKCASVLFAKGELYCFAVIFGFHRVIFASRV
ncbi:MAG: hypothetical protein IIX54_04335, partial [Clostridia bacterium]|nr:hypothetical protein [Clostridia bacterium]